ncbi:Putative peroxiredoxin bcp [Salinivirga cyanobacteriivorans]|uniref:thioredoxin-dependent peroxiredoxin n=1 Tax=Salinivirga cyanobacteriivorans TaxID=1307839 RepID=A0A0S2I2P5_9BACT|nr:thioredoxin-dependent thiol peroxidase [Salinivirga cyanobacteriivorans]ALO16578.1 Putative peroxiredoxin bcp [Salinivirga cyanobacteriivorans]
MITLKAGDKAPDFQAKNQDGEPITLSDFKGKKLILYFYPKDNTPGCTAEACNLNDNYSELTDKGFEVVGVSPDNIESHQKFIAKYNLSFHLVADPEKEVINKYGVWGEKNMYGKKSMGLLRTTFVIDEDGIIQHVFKRVKTKDHTNQILEKVN